MPQTKLVAVGLAAFVLSGTSFAATDGLPADTLTGGKAFGSWEQAKPGVTRLIRPTDLPPPFDTESASNSPGQASKPADARPQVPEGFTVTEFASGLSEP